MNATDARTETGAGTDLATTRGTNAMTGRVTPEEWRMIGQQAMVLEQAGKGTSILPKGITTRYQIAAILLKGAELGFGTMYSLDKITLINGSPFVESEALMALIQREHGWKAIKLMEMDDRHCIVGFKQPGDEDYQTLQWTIEMAERAKLTGKDVWKQYPRTMLKWRAIGEGARTFFAATLAGIRLVDESEMPVIVTPSGDIAFDRTAIEAVASVPANQSAERAFEGEIVDSVPDGIEDVATPSGTVDAATGEILSPEPRHATEDNTPFEAEEPEVEAPTGGLLANPNQLKAIRQLSNQLGHPEMPSETMTYAEAETRIRELSAEGNAQKRNGGRA